MGYNTPNEHLHWFVNTSGIIIHSNETANRAISVVLKLTLVEDEWNKYDSLLVCLS